MNTTSVYLGRITLPEFHIQTEEYWLHRVDYSVNAPTLEEAMQMILQGEVSYDSAKVVEGADEVENICSVNGAAVSEEENERLLAEHKARRRWQQQESNKDSP